MDHKHTSHEDLVDIDWTQLINMLGGVTNVSASLPYPELKRKSVYQWWLRCSVPGKYVLPLVNLAISKKVLAKIEDLPKLDPFREVRT